MELKRSPVDRPTEYQGVRFRSEIKAAWAALDALTDGRKAALGR